MNNAFALATLSIFYACAAHAGEPTPRSLASYSANSIPVGQYHYAMRVEAAEKPGMTHTDAAPATGPVTLVYEDRHGQVHEVRYLLEGGRVQSQS